MFRCGNTMLTCNCCTSLGFKIDLFYFPCRRKNAHESLLEDTCHHISLKLRKPLKDLIASLSLADTLLSLTTMPSNIL